MKEKTARQFSKRSASFSSPRRAQGLALKKHVRVMTGRRGPARTPPPPSYLTSPSLRTSCLALSAALPLICCAYPAFLPSRPVCCCTILGLFLFYFSIYVSRKTAEGDQGGEEG